MYAEIPPVKRVRNVAGMRALGALPKAAIPEKIDEPSLHNIIVVRVETQDYTVRNDKAGII